MGVILGYAPPMPIVLFANPNSPDPSEREGPRTVSIFDALRSHSVEESLDGPVRECTTSFDAAHTNVVEILLDSATGLATAKTYADDTVVSYSHTADGRPLRTMWARGEWRESEYDAARREVARSYSDPSLNCAFERDVFGAIIAASNAVAGIAILRDNPGMATIFKAFAYALDNLLRPTGRNADTFDYDARSQLTSATLRSAATNTFSYAYDNIGNRSSAMEAGIATSYTANELNQYSAIAELLPAYDADGNLLTNGVWSYEWDAENRLSAVYQNGSCVVSNAYDAFSRRVLKVTPAETHTFLSDGWNVVREVVRSSATGAVTETLDYYWGRDLSGSLQGAGGVGGLLAYTRNGALRIPVYDHIGNVVAVVDGSGAVLASYEYDPFGNIVAQSGAEADEVPFRFSTKYFDSETGLYYYGYRFYAPELGRWINRDPVEEEGGENLYDFCNNSPLSVFDKLGKDIYLVQGNDTGNAINDTYHQAVCVDEWGVRGVGQKPCGRRCYSFATTWRLRAFPRKFIWLGWFSYTPVGVWMEGKIYDHEFVGTVLRTKKTSRWQDQAWGEYMNHRMGKTDVYSVLHHNCRLFSQLEFADAPGH